MNPLNRPAETAPIVAIAIARLAGPLLGLEDDRVLDLATAIAFLPAAVTWAVLRFRSDAIEG